jgi:hypothetical protein
MHDDRENRAYVMMKDLAYLEETQERAWPPHFYEAASSVTGIQFVMGANDDALHVDVPGLTNVGYMEQPVFLDALSRSIVLIGVGRPATCVGSSPATLFCSTTAFLFPDHRHPTKDFA